ncbi:MAG TPA: CBS and ACT domain-containing protein [Oscillospiraceae bacterium]|nr:CBS and ACT domain-containing protein [Oscillospiraceae bacterium]
MLVKDRMSPHVYTITPDTPIPDALQLMEEKKIRRLPVIDKDRLVGIVTLLDLVRASPSPATSLSVWELNYLLAKLPVKDVMAKQVYCVTPETTIDKAASLMREHSIGGLPVLDGEQIVGMITETDIFTAFLEMLGVHRGGLRLTLELTERHGALADIALLFRDFGVNIVSAVAFISDEDQELAHSVWRLEGCDDVEGLIKYLQEKEYKVIHYSLNGAGTEV